jgi:hypothetical protein
MGATHRGCLLLLGCLSSAFGATVTFDRNYFVGFGFAGPPPASVAVPGFNPALGTLTGVSLTASIDNTLEFSAQSTREGASLTGVFDPLYTLSAPDSTPLLTLNPQQPYDSGPIPFLVIRDFFATPGSDTATASAASVVPFLSAGDVDLPLSLTAHFSFPSPDIAVRAFYGRGDLSLSLTYEYVPIPEPATFGITAGAWLVLRRLRRALP